MRPATLWFDQATKDGATVSTVTLEDLAGAEPRLSFSYAALDTPGLPAPAVLDSVAAAALLHVQSLGQDLAVRGPMTRLGLFNLGELAAARRGTSPDRYPRVAALRPDSIVDEVAPPLEPDAASLSFSGGLDSTFTAARLGRGLGAPGAPRLGQLVIVQGFDSRLDCPDGLASMVARVEPLARDAGVPLSVVRTDAWSVGGALWPHTATPLMGAALSMFAHRYGVGIIGGGIPYGAGKVGLGHPAILDQFCGGAAFRMTTDGAGWSRAQKLRFLLDYPETLKHLRVCLRGFSADGDPGRNCGECGKCLDLWMTFRMIGVADPPCFDAPVNPALIETLVVPSVYEARDLGCAHDDAVEIGVRESWFELLSRRLAYVPPSPNLVREAGLRLRAAMPGSVRGAIRRLLPVHLRP